MTIDESPTWLIYDTPDGRLGWLRVPDGAEPRFWAPTPHRALGHVDPAAVLSWLRDRRDIWEPDDFGDLDVVEHLRTMIISRLATPG